MHLLGLNFAKIHHEVGSQSSMSPIPSFLLSLFFARTRQGETPSTCHSSDHHVHHTAQRVGNYKPTAIAVHPISWSGIFQRGVLYLQKNWSSELNIQYLEKLSFILPSLQFWFPFLCQDILGSETGVASQMSTGRICLRMPCIYLIQMIFERSSESRTKCMIWSSIWLTSIFTTTCILSIQIWKFVLYRILSAKNNMDMYLYGPTKSSERTIPYIATRSKSQTWYSYSMIQIAASSTNCWSSMNPPPPTHHNYS